MKFYYLRAIVVILMLASVSVQAQSVKQKKADRYFDLFKFDKAIEQYERVVEKEPENYHALRRLGDSYRLTGRPSQAENWYGQAVQSPEADSMVFFYYAQALRDNGKYDEAKQYYQKYATKAPNDPRGNKLANAMDNVAELKKDSLNYRVWNIESLNTPAYEFSPTFTKDGLAFSSNRGKGKGDVWTGGMAFLNMYEATKTDTGFTEATELPGKINTKFHEGPVTFNKDFTQIYFTRNLYIKGKKKTGEEDIVKLNIFSATLENGEWKDVQNLPFNSKEYSCGHPTLAADGKTLYFSSDMPGGYGGLDLYKAVWNDSSWTEPENLGPEVNTPGDEQFPFIHQDGTLYFASNSYAGLGGLDIYYSTQKNGKWGDVTNMGYPINTSGDDFGLIFDEDKETGYLTSNREGGNGQDDIYGFDKKALELAGIVYDRITGDPIDSATVHLILGSDTLGSATTNVDGEFNFDVQSGLTYTIPAWKEGYNPNKLNVNTDGLTNDSPPVRIPLDRGELLLVGTTFEVKVNESTLEEERIGTLDAVKVYLYDLTNNTIDSTLSDGNGGFVFTIQPETEYKLTGDKDFYFLKSEVEFNTETNATGTVEVELELYKIAGTIRLVNIYYDFDKYNIRPDAAKELERVYGILVKYPDLVIQMRSHTDCRGSQSYNMVLSANRAQSAANFLIDLGAKNGFDLLPNITAAGFGETNPIYADLCETEQGKQDSELSKDLVDKHQMNRRTEFLVIQQPKNIRVQSSVQK